MEQYDNPLVRSIKYTDLQGIMFEDLVVGKYYFLIKELLREGRIIKGGYFVHITNKTEQTVTFKHLHLFEPGRMRWMAILPSVPADVATVARVNNREPLTDASPSRFLFLIRKSEVLPPPVLNAVPEQEGTVTKRPGNGKGRRSTRRTRRTRRNNRQKN